MTEALIMAVLAANQEGAQEDGAEDNQKETGELAHFGIMGMKWGVRRFQNKDGTRTAAGKERYNGPYVSKATKKNEGKLRKAYEKGISEKNTTGSVSDKTRKKIKALEDILDASRTSDAIVKKYGTNPVTGKSSVHQLMKGPWRKTELGKQVRKWQITSAALAGTTALSLGATVLSLKEVKKHSGNYVKVSDELWKTSRELKDTKTLLERKKQQIENMDNLLFKKQQEINRLTSKHSAQ